jgi:hypothetical protein
VTNRRAQIFGAGRPACADLCADGAFDHLHVAIPPLLHALIEIDEPLAELGILRIVAINGDEHFLNCGRGLRQRAADAW